MNPIELTRALKGKWHGSYGTAKCPAHEDRSPSLAIGIAKTGKVLVKCHAGCTQESVIDARFVVSIFGVANRATFVRSRPHLTRIPIVMVSMR